MKMFNGVRVIDLYISTLLVDSRFSLGCHIGVICLVSANNIASINIVL